MIEYNSLNSYLNELKGLHRKREKYWRSEYLTIIASRLSEYGIQFEYNDDGITNLVFLSINLRTKKSTLSAVFSNTFGSLHILDTNTRISTTVSTFNSIKKFCNQSDRIKDSELLASKNPSLLEWKVYSFLKKKRVDNHQVIITSNPLFEYTQHLSNLLKLNIDCKNISISDERYKISIIYEVKESHHRIYIEMESEPLQLFMKFYVRDNKFHTFQAYTKPLVRKKAEYELLKKCNEIDELRSLRIVNQVEDSLSSIVMNSDIL